MKHANIAIFVPHLGCPQQCSFCEQRAITGRVQAPPPRAADVEEAARAASASLGERRRETEIAFFGGSFTAIQQEYMLELLEAGAQAVARYGFRGIPCSTRPDAVGREVLDILKAYPVTAVELGAQSMDNGVLAANRRGHTAQDTARAAERLHEAGIELGLQMMTGLYKDTPEKTLRTAEALIGLEPKTVRIYPTLVLPGTELARLYEAGLYRPQSLEEAVELCARLLERFQKAGAAVIRMGLHPGPELEQRRLAGPYHPAFRQLVESRLFLYRLKKALGGPGRYRVEVNPREFSTALGQKRENLKRLAGAGYQVTLAQAEAVPAGEFRVAAGPGIQKGAP